jgi:DNA-binding MarR family transcriptional regulator
VVRILTISARPRSVKGDPGPAIRVPPSFDEEYPDGDRLATEVFLNLGVLTGTVRSAVEGILTDSGLPSMAAFNALSVLAGDPGPLRPSVVAARMMVTRATITGLLDSLARRGLVRRLAAGEDGRTRPVAITPAGRRIAARVVPEMHRFERALMSALDRDELEALLDVVARLQRRTAELAPGSRPGIDG